MPKTLIVPLDGSVTAERALAVATRLARQLERCELVPVSVDADVVDRHRPSVEAVAAGLVEPVSVRVECDAGDFDAVLDPAVEWSTALDLRLSLVRVFSPDELSEREEHASFAPALHQLVSPERISTVALHDEVPAHAITRYARELPATLLALTTRARRGIGRAVLGSVAMDVVKGSPCPVVAVRRP